MVLIATCQILPHLLFHLYLPQTNCFSLHMEALEWQLQELLTEIIWLAVFLRKGELAMDS